jgi:hypothetical protein
VFLYLYTFLCYNNINMSGEKSYGLLPNINKLGELNWQPAVLSSGEVIIGVRTTIGDNAPRFINNIQNFIKEAYADACVRSYNIGQIMHLEIDTLLNAVARETLGGDVRYNVLESRPLVEGGTTRDPGFHFDGNINYATNTLDLKRVITWATLASTLVTNCGNIDFANMRAIKSADRVFVPEPGQLVEIEQLGHYKGVALHCTPTGCEATGMIGLRTFIRFAG